METYGCGRAIGSEEETREIDKNILEASNSVEKPRINYC